MDRNHARVRTTHVRRSTLVLVSMAFLLCVNAAAASEIPSPASCLAGLLTVEPGSNWKRDEAVRYFKCFPDTYQELKSVFGYEEISATSASFGPLYDNAYQHIEALEETQEYVATEEYVRKLLSISVNGKMQADAVNFFQQLLRQEMQRKRNLFISQLNTRENSEITGFWTFYYSNLEGEFRPTSTEAVESPCYKSGDKSCDILRSIGWQER